MIAIKESDIVMCTVKRIEGTTVFLEIEGNGPGSMVLSEVAAGRIRNLREYVSPNKKVVCKVLKISPEHIELSLRRVTGKERENTVEKYKKERTFASMLKAIFTNSEKLITKIKEEYEISDFYDKVRETPSLIEKFASKQESEKLAKLLMEKREREKEVKKTFILQSFSDSGIKDIKESLSSKEASIKYLGSSKFSISASAKDFKEANSKVDSVLQKIESKAKEKKSHFELKEAK